MFPIPMTLTVRICRIAVLLMVTGAISVASASAQEEAAKPVGTPRVAPPQPVSSAVPSGQTISSAENDYVLSAGDTIELSVFREPDLTSHSTIARDGSVQLPLIREVKLAGMTVRDARTFLTKLYGEKYFKLNAKGMAEGKTEMFEILPGDIITVGESWF